MPSTASSDIRLELMAAGEKSNEWGDITNTNLSMIDGITTGYTTISMTSGSATITVSDYTLGTYHNAVFRLTGTPASAATLTVPSYERAYIIDNQCGQSVTVRVGALTGTAVPAGKKAILYCDGTDIREVVNAPVPDSRTITAGTGLTGGGDLSANRTLSIPTSGVTTTLVADSAITTVKVADSAITSAKIADGTIVTTDLADGAVTSAKIADGTIQNGDLADSAVSGAKVADGGVGYAKLSGVATAAEFRANTASRVLPVNSVWSAADMVNLTDGATITPDFSAGFNFQVTIAGNRTLANPSNPKAGQSGVIVVTQDATGGRTLAFGTAYKFPNGVTPTIDTASGRVNVLSYFVVNSSFIIIIPLYGVR